MMSLWFGSLFLTSKLAKLVRFDQSDLPGHNRGVVGLSATSKSNSTGALDTALNAIEAGSSPVRHVAVFLVRRI